MATRGSIRDERVLLHGHEVAFLTGGTGETLLFIHGIAGSCGTFDTVLEDVAEHHHVIAPDLLGHGRSAKPKGDYSLGAYASGLRDLLEVMEIEQVTVIGHSMGGGVAMQFAYQFPERCNRLVLVASGGLGPEVTMLLRAATLPGSDLFLKLVTSDRAKRWFSSATDPLRRWGIQPTPSMVHVGEHFACLQDRNTRHAFLHTARSVLDLRGQRIDARDRLYLAQELPTLIVWGDRDRFIPVAHGRAAHDLIPNSRLEVFEGAGHFPHRDEPERFTKVLLEFLAETEPARLSTDVMRALARERSNISA